MFDLTLRLIFCSTALTALASCNYKEKPQISSGRSQESHTDKISRIKAAIQQKISLAQEAEYARELRLMLIELGAHESANEVDAKNTLDIVLLGQEICSKIRAEFPNISDQEYKEAHSSVGIALLWKGTSEDKFITILLREANLLCRAAQHMLEQLYWYPTEGLTRYDPRIVNFFKEKAEEGSLREKYQYGKILLQGRGVESNEEMGSKLMEQSKFADAYMDLAIHYYEKNAVKFEHYLRLAATSNHPQGLYNLGILEQSKKHYAEAIKLFQKTLDVEPTYYEATFELGRMHVEGWGTQKNIQKGIDLFTTVVNLSEDKELKNLALKNISIFKETCAILTY